MTADILLARRLLEAAADAQGDRASAEDAGAELATILARSGLSTLAALFGDLDGVRADDLTPDAWLFLLQSRNKEASEAEDAVLDQLYLENPDPSMRFRLVAAALAHPATDLRYRRAEIASLDVLRVDSLPASWPRTRLMTLDALARSPAELPSEPPGEALAEFVLYLLQDGSEAALSLAAAAVAPGEGWREPARNVARIVVRNADPQLDGYGRFFRTAEI